MSFLQETPSATRTGTYIYDSVVGRCVKISDRVQNGGRSSWEREDTPFHKKIMQGYRKAADRGQPMAWKPDRIKALWGDN